MSILARLLCAVAALFSLSAAARPFDCGPMLLLPAPDSLSVVVHHATPVAATLLYHPEGRDAERSLIRHARASDHHLFNLSGLEPGTRYLYRITAGEVDSGTRAFRTLEADPRRYTLLAAGDLRTQPRQFRRVAEAMRRNEPHAAAWITTGDFPADGRNYCMWINEFFSPGRELLAGLPVWPCIGNHERTRTSDGQLDPESHYFRLFTFPGEHRADYYRWDYGHHTLLMLDSCGPMGPESEQYAWLVSQLRSPRRAFTLVAFHHPVYTSGPHGRLREDGQPAEAPIRVARNEWRPLFERYGVDLVLHGHDHLYERSQGAGIHYVVTGGAGAPLYDPDRVPNPSQVVAKKAHHYCRITLTPTRLTLEAVEVGGQVFDSFFIRKPIASRRAVERSGAAAD